MFKLGAIAAAATIAVGMCSLSTDALARVGGGHTGGGGGAHFGGGGAHFRGGMANFGDGARFGGARFAGNVGGWNGYRGGYRSYGGYGGRRYGCGRIRAGRRARRRLLGLRELLRLDATRLREPVWLRL